MNPANVNMANMAAMGVGVPGTGPMPMNNIPGAPNNGARVPLDDQQRTILNTYIYEYFIRFDMFDCARVLVNGNHNVRLIKDSSIRRRDENGNIGNGTDDAMDTDNKDDMEGKLPDDLLLPNVPKLSDGTSFLHGWFCLFWDMYLAQTQKSTNGPTNGIVNQYVSHTQQQSRIRQSQQQEMLRTMRSDMSQQQAAGYPAQFMRMQNGPMPMGAMKQGGLVRAAMANNQTNPQMQQILQQAKQNHMQRDPSDIDGSRPRPSSPGSADNAPSPSKRPRLEGPFPNQPGMMPNGRPAQGIPGQPVGSATQAQQMLLQHGINPAQLTQAQFQQFSQQTPSAQAKSIATYAANLQQHQGQQMPMKQIPNQAIPQGHGSPMMPPGPDGAALNAYYNAGDMGPGGMRPGPGGPQTGTGNHALQDYQMQLMLLEQQNKKRLMMARQEQDGNLSGVPRPDGPPGAPGSTPGPNGQVFPETSPQGTRTGTSPNPSDQMKRGTPQMNNAGIPSPLPDGAQSRGSPNPMNFMGNEMNPGHGPQFFKGGMDMQNGQMNGMRPPSSHPGQSFNGQMTPQMIAATRQQQQQQQQGGAGQASPQISWQAGPNGTPMMNQGPPITQGPQGPIQGTPQQRSMPPPSGPAAAASNNNRNQTSSPQQSTPQPPTPSQPNKPAPKKKESKSAKDKRAAAQKKSNPNLNASATPAAEAAPDVEPPTPATPITPANPAAFKQTQTTTTSAPVPNEQQPTVSAPPPSTQVVPHTDPASGGFMDSNATMDFSSMDFANPLTTGDVLDGFDFDSFLHDNDGDNAGFDFNTGPFAMEGAGEIGAE